METMDILYMILIAALIVVSIILVVIGIYVISILFMVKQVLRRVDTIAYNVLNVKTFAKMGALGVISKLFGMIRKGGGDNGR